MISRKAMSDKVIKPYQWLFFNRILLFIWIFSNTLDTSGATPVVQANGTAPLGSTFRNDIAAALTAREACVDADRSTPVTGDVAACQGEWYGHVQNASSVLCADGFSVCTWEDKWILKQIPWNVATQIVGCYAYNAAQDGGRCQSCRENDPQSDDLAAIGHDCTHTNFGQTGCLLEGQISATCCVDSLQRKACAYSESLTNGVLCCRRQPTMPPRPQNDQPHKTDTTVLAPPMQMIRLVGERVQLRCPLIGVEETRDSSARRRSSIDSSKKVLWLKDGHVLPNVQSATWTITFATISHSGVYACRKGQLTAMAVSHINLTINAVHTRACADGTSDGFHDGHHVRACAGSWTGHVRRAASTLCGRGWRVCTPKDRPFLDQIDPLYLTEFGGCFGYNAAHIRKRCRKCKDRQIMAALGGDCPVNEKQGDDNTNSPSTCYTNRKIAAYSDKVGHPHAVSGCNYRPGKGVTGVMCCRRWQKGGARNGSTKTVGGQVQNQNPSSRQWSSSQISAETGTSECYPACRNGGTCLVNGQCLCPKGYSGGACQHGGCSPRCINGGECLYGFCKCVYPFHGDYCQFSSLMPNDAPIALEVGRRTFDDNKLEDRLAKKRRAAPKIT